VDDRLFWFFHAKPDSPHALTIAMIALTIVGGGWALVGLVPLAIVARTRRLAAAIAIIVATQSLVVVALKSVVMRVRPWRALGVAPVYDMPTDFSFPSGHAAGSFSVAAFVTVVVLSTPSFSRRARVALVAIVVALATSIAASRLYLGVHYASDVAAGALIGALIGALGGKAYVRYTRARARRSTRTPEL
jgi:undecaprenyl-diphosphatase